VSLSLQGKNLWQTTDYQGLDPEATDRGLDRGEYAFEYYNMAPPGILILHMQVNFSCVPGREGPDFRQWPLLRSSFPGVTLKFSTRELSKTLTW
jgi:hypothetical protein